MDGEWRTKYKNCSVVDHRLFGILPRFLEGPGSYSLDSVENTRTETEVEIEIEVEKEKEIVKEKEIETDNVVTEISNIFISEDELTVKSGEDSLTSVSSLRNILAGKHIIPTDFKTETETETEGNINIDKIGTCDISSDLEPCIPDSFLNLNSFDKCAFVCSHTEETEQDPFIALSGPLTVLAVLAVLPPCRLSSSSPSISSPVSPLSLLSPPLSPIPPIPPLLPPPHSPSLSPPRCTSSPHFSSPSSSSSTSTSSPRSSRSSSSSTIDFNTLHESLSGDVIDDVIKTKWPNDSCTSDQPLTLKGLKNNENTINSFSCHRGVEWINERSEGDEESWSEKKKMKDEKRKNENENENENGNENESRGSKSLLAVQKPSIHFNDMMDSRLITDSSTHKEHRPNSSNDNMHADTITDLDLKNTDGEERKRNIFSDKYNDGNSDRCGEGQQVKDLSGPTAASSHHTVHRNLTVNKPSRRPLQWNLLGDKTQFCPIPSYAQAFINSKSMGGMTENTTTSCVREAENDVEEKEKEKEIASSSSHSTALLFKKHYKHSIQLLGLVSCSVTPAVRTTV